MTLFDMLFVYYEAMGKKKMEVSEFGLRVSKAIRAGMGIRRKSGRALGEDIGRSYTYIQARVNNENEWSLSDIEAICDAWGITPEELLNQG